MDNQEILAAIQEIVRDITGDDEVELTAETVAEDVDGWDSVNHIKIILAIESEFGIRFEVEEVGGIEDVGDIVDLVAAKV